MSESLDLAIDYAIYLKKVEADLARAREFLQELAVAAESAEVGADQYEQASIDTERRIGREARAFLASGES